MRDGEPDCVLMVSHGLTSFRPPSEESGRCFLLARRAVVTFQKAIVAACEHIDLLQTTGLGAERSPITSEMFEVQYDPPGIFKVASKGTLGLRRLAAHSRDSVPNVGGQTIDVLRIPTIWS